MLPPRKRGGLRGSDHKGKLAPGPVGAKVGQQVGGGAALGCLIELGQLAGHGHLPVAKEAIQISQRSQQTVR